MFTFVFYLYTLRRSVFWHQVHNTNVGFRALVMGGWAHREKGGFYVGPRPCLGLSVTHSFLLNN